MCKIEVAALMPDSFIHQPFSIANAVSNLAIPIRLLPHK